MKDTREWYVADYYNILGYAKKEHGSEHVFTAINAATAAQIVNDHNNLHAPSSVTDVAFSQLVRRCREQRHELRTLADENAALKVTLAKAKLKTFHLRNRMSDLLSRIDSLTAATWDWTSQYYQPEHEPDESGCE